MSCPYYEYKSGLLFGDYWCIKKDESVDSDIYYKYCRNYDYSYCPIYKQQASSGCFVTTIACQILGLTDDNFVLNNLRNFRDNILQVDEKYYDILKEYDVIGPKIVDAILNDKDKKQMALGLYQYSLLPINDLISKREYDKAVETYYLTTLMLINYYGLKHEYNHIRDNDYYYEEFKAKEAGHGYKKIKNIKGTFQ
jgi:hypothetical protein